jgi:hypothetical protein
MTTPTWTPAFSTKFAFIKSQVAAGKTITEATALYNAAKTVELVLYGYDKTDAQPFYGFQAKETAIPVAGIPMSRPIDYKQADAVDFDYYALIALNS